MAAMVDLLYNACIIFNIIPINTIMYLEKQKLKPFWLFWKKTLIFKSLYHFLNICTRKLHLQICVKNEGFLRYSSQGALKQSFKIIASHLLCT